MVEFAVVGHPNKGKSSIVATLAENERVAIGATPGTTHQADRYQFSIDGETLYTLVDTPGFQRAKTVLDWLQTHATDASDRAEVVAAFVRAHKDDPRFHDECELLQPIIDGAGILYVVDGAKPYGAEFEVEMLILQWTGRPRMALINLIGEGDYLQHWQSALGQYFSVVRVFDAMHADFSARIHLLSAFAELEEDWRPAMNRAIAALQADRQHRLSRSAAEIAEALIDCLTWTESGALPEGESTARLQGQLSEQLQRRVRLREQRARSVVQGYYRHEHMHSEENALALLDMDLFTAEGWELFGLSRTQLLITGAMTGAIAGLGIDALAGGATLLLGAGIGALLGGVGTWLGGDELAKTQVLGNALGGRTLRVGPVTAANFPWVFLGRAWAHHHLVAERNHALRDAASTAIADQGNLMDQIDEDLRKQLAQIFREVRDSGRTAELAQRLGQSVEALLALTPAK